MTSERPSDCVAAASPAGPASAHAWAACALRMAATALETLEFIFTLPGSLSRNRRMRLSLGSNHVSSWSEVRETMYPSTTSSASHGANLTVLHLTLPVACSRTRWPPSNHCRRFGREADAG